MGDVALEPVTEPGLVVILVMVDEGLTVLQVETKQ